MRTLNLRAITGGPGRHHLGYTCLTPGAISYTHRHEDFGEFFLVTGGVGQEVRNGERKLLERGALGFAGPDDEHYYIDLSPPGTALRFLNLALPWSWWKGLTEVAGTPLEAVSTGRLARLADPDVAAAEARLERFFDQPAEATLERVETVLWLARWWHREGEREDRPHVWPEWLRQFEAERRDPTLMSQPISFWYERSGRTPEHFARTCRRVLGASPTELLNRARIDWVKRRLRERPATVTELAFAVGFGNLGYFHRTFRRFSGCAPREWVRRQDASVTVPR